MRHSHANVSREEGKKEGKKEGREEGIWSCLNTTMKKFSLDLPAAMDLMDIPLNDRETYVKMAQGIA